MNPIFQEIFILRILFSLRRRTAVLIVVWACIAGLKPLPADGASIILGPERQLFLDDYLIASMKQVNRVVEPAQKFAGNPVLWQREKWEPEMATIYGSVIRDEGKFKMWYKSGMGVGYAESDDGIRWTKPPLELTVIDGNRSNILFRKKSKTEGPDGLPYFYELFGVHRDDRDPDPARRYKMGFLSIDWKYTGKDGDPWHKGQRRGLGVAGSPDGIHWKLINHWATEAIVDGATHWMFESNKYVLYGRTRKALPEVQTAWSTNDWFKKWFSGRAVARVESPDLLEWNYKKPDTAPVALTAELADKPGTEIYSMKVFRYESQYIGLVQVFHATPEDSTLEIELASSRDGIHFTRVGRGVPFIGVSGPGNWDRFNLSPANNDPIRVGDDLRIYYAGRMYRHGPYSGADKGPERSGIGFASVRRDRFVALEASFDGGEIVTKPLRLKGRTLHLNAKADFGSITLSAEDADGKIVAKSETIHADALDLPVKWNGVASLADPVSLRIRMENARLFAIWAE
jgi:hypothetical protein